MNQRFIQIRLDGRKQRALFKARMFAQGFGKAPVPFSILILRRSQHTAQRSVICLKTLLQSRIKLAPMRRKLRFFRGKMRQQIGAVVFNIGLMIGGRRA